MNVIVVKCVGEFVGALVVNDDVAETTYQRLKECDRYELHEIRRFPVDSLNDVLSEIANENDQHADNMGGDYMVRP